MAKGSVDGFNREIPVGVVANEGDQGVLSDIERDLSNRASVEGMIAVHRGPGIRPDAPEMGDLAWDVWGWIVVLDQCGELLD